MSIRIKMKNTKANKTIRRKSFLIKIEQVIFSHYTELRYRCFKLEISVTEICLFTVCITSINSCKIISTANKQLILQLVMNSKTYETICNFFRIKLIQKIAAVVGQSTRYTNMYTLRL